MHFWLKYQFLNTGTPEQPKVGNTPKLNTVEFNEYVEKIQIWAASEYGVVIPDPNEADY